MKFQLFICTLLVAGLSVLIQADVPSVRLNNGVLMPAIAAGTWQYSPAVAEQSVHDAFAAGFNHIDTALDYKNQIGVGKALSAKPRSSYFLTTKVPGCGLQGISFEQCHADTQKAYDEDLKQLGLDYVDLLLVHFPPLGGCSSGRNCKAIQDQWSALEMAYATKKAKAIGVSNFCQSCFECLKKSMNVTPAVNQIQYHVGMGPDPNGLKSYCKGLGVHLQAYSPLGNNASALIDGPILGNIGQRHNKSAVQVALEWIWSNNVPVVTKSSKLTHLKEDLDIFDWSTTKEEKKLLDSQTKPAGKPSFMCSS